MIGLYSANSQAITSTPFSFGNALKFDGTDDYVTYSQVNFNLADNWTIGAWVKTSKTTLNVLFGNSTLQRFISISRTAVILNDATAGRTVNYTDVGSNVWFYFSLVSNGDLYIDGSNVGSFNMADFSNDFSFTTLGRFTSAYFEGTIDEVAFWNTNLNSTQISNLWANGDGDYATNYSPANLIAYWRMNGTSGDTTAIDEQGTYNGTLNNFNTSTCWVAH